MLCRSEELEGHVGVCDDRAPLLSDGLVYHAGAFDVACLSFAYSEDGGDALDSMHKAWGAVCWLAAATEGVLYRLVDNLCELSYGEVDDSGVLIYHVFEVLFVLVAGEGFEPPSTLSRVVDVAVKGLYLLSYPVRWGGLLAFLPWLIMIYSSASLRWSIACDPESAAGNSSGSFEELFRSLREEWDSNPHAPGCSRMSILSAILPGGGQGPAGQTNISNCLKTAACRPVHVSFVSVVEASVCGDLPGSIAVLAESWKVWVGAGSAAMWADDWVIVFAHGLGLLRATSPRT